MDWKKIKKFLPIIGIALFVYLLVKLDVIKILQEIRKVNIFYILIAFLIAGAFFIIQTLKWFVLARKQKIKIIFKEAFKINFISNFYGFVTPSRIGSIIRINYLNKYGTNTGKGLSNFVIDKVLDLITLFILTILFSFIFYRKIISSVFSPLSQGIIILIFLLIIGISLLFYKKENIKPIARIVYKIFIPKRLKEKGKTMFNSFYEDMPSIGSLFSVFMITLTTWIVNYVVVYFIGLSLGIKIGFIPFLIILPIATLIAQIPITINGLGTRELVMINLFGLFGVDAVKIFSMSVIGIVITNIIPALIALVFIWQKEK